MVKLRKRILKQCDKRKQPRYEYTRYSFEFPAKLNQQIRALVDKKFEISLYLEEDFKQETLKISLTRKKTINTNPTKQ